MGGNTGQAATDLLNGGEFERELRPGETIVLALK